MFSAPLASLRSQETLGFLRSSRSAGLTGFLYGETPSFPDPLLLQMVYFLVSLWGVCLRHHLQNFLSSILRSTLRLFLRDQ